MMGNMSLLNYLKSLKSKHFVYVYICAYTHVHVFTLADNSVGKIYSTPSRLNSVSNLSCELSTCAVLRAAERVKCHTGADGLRIQITLPLTCWELDLY